MKKKRIRQKSKKRKNAAYFFTSFFITVVVLCSAAGIVIADRNTQEIGWNNEKTVLAFSNSETKLDITIMGNDYEISKVLPDGVSSIIKGLDRGFAVIEPSGLRLFYEIYMVIKPYAKELIFGLLGNLA